MRQLVRLLSGDNDLVPFHLWWRKIVLRSEKVYKYFVQDCSSLTNHKFFFKYRWNPLKIPLGRSFLIKCSHLIWNYTGVLFSRVVVRILTTPVYLFVKHFWAATSVHRGVFRTLSGSWDPGLWENIFKAKGRWLCLWEVLS